MDTLVLNETRLIVVNKRTVRIEIFRNLESGLHRLMTYEARQLNETPPSPHAPRVWATLAYNYEETEDVDGAVSQIIEKVKKGAAPDFMGAQ